FEVRAPELGFGSFLLGRRVGLRGLELCKFGLELAGRAEELEELAREVRGLPPCFAEKLFACGGIASQLCVIGAEKIFREDDVVRKALVGVEIELQIEVRVVTHALAEEGIDVGAVEGVCNFASEGGVVL